MAVLYIFGMYGHPWALATACLMLMAFVFGNGSRLAKLLLTNRELLKRPSRTGSPRQIEPTSKDTGPLR